MASPVILKCERKCNFCKIKENNKLKYGPLYEFNRVVAHYYCVLLSTKMKQNGKDNEGIMGFLLDDINTELRRSKNISCVYCREKNATVKCGHQGCKKVFHYPCGLEAGALSRFKNDFISFCVLHRPKQRVPKKILQEAVNTEMICSICYETVDPKDRINNLWAPCCMRAWYHRNCVQKLAQSSGYFFRCATCNDSEKFKTHMEDNGIFVPQQDASWELVPNAYEELLVRHNRCDAEECKCPNGREENEEDTRWEITLCRCCGSQGIHVGCGDLKFTDPQWECATCQSIMKTDSKSTETEDQAKDDLSLKKSTSKSDQPGTAPRKRKLSEQSEVEDQNKKEKLDEEESSDDEPNGQTATTSGDEFYIRLPDGRNDKPHTVTRPDEGNEEQEVDVISMNSAWLMVEEVLSRVKPAPLSYKLKFLRNKCFAFHFDPFDIREEPETIDLVSDSENDEVDADSENDEVDADPEDNDVHRDSEDDEVDADSENDEVDADPEDNDVHRDSEDDEVDADSENDEVDADPEDDEVDADPENDEVDADPENDEVNADSEIDEVNADSEVDEVNEDSEVDEVNEDSEVDEVNEDSEVDEVNADPENDEVNADSEVDEVNADSEIDEVDADSEVDEVNADSEIDEVNADSEDNEVDADSEIDEVDADSEDNEVDADSENDELDSDSDDCSDIEIIEEMLSGNNRQSRPEQEKMDSEPTDQYLQTQELSHQPAVKPVDGCVSNVIDVVDISDDEGDGGADECHCRKIGGSPQGHPHPSTITYERQFGNLVAVNSDVEMTPYESNENYNVRFGYTNYRGFQSESQEQEVSEDDDEVEEAFVRQPGQKYSGRRIKHHSEVKKPRMTTDIQGSIINPSPTNSSSWQGLGAFSSFASAYFTPQTFGEHSNIMRGASFSGYNVAQGSSSMFLSNAPLQHHTYDFSNPKGQPVSTTSMISTAIPSEHSGSTITEPFSSGMVMSESSSSGMLISESSSSGMVISEPSSAMSTSVIATPKSSTSGMDICEPSASGVATALSSFQYLSTSLPNISPPLSSPSPYSPGSMFIRRPRPIFTALDTSSSSEGSTEVFLGGDQNAGILCSCTNEKKNS